MRVRRRRSRVGDVDWGGRCWRGGLVAVPGDRCVDGGRVSVASVAMLESILHWEMRSGRRCQYCWRCGRWVWRRTLGGIRVERARRWMKLILTAGAQLASIALVRRAASRGERTWAGKTMGRDGVVGGCGRQVLTAASFLRPGSSAWQAHRTSRSSNIDITTDVDDLHSTTPPPCPPSAGQLAPASSRPHCDPLRHAPLPPHTAHTRPTRTFPTSTRRPPKMRPPSPSRATLPRSGRRAPPRA